MLISGLAGRHARINGVYTPTLSETQNGRVVFAKANDPDLWLRYCVDSQWAVSSTARKDANSTNCFFYSVERGVALPHEAKSWNATEDNHDVLQPGARVQAGQVRTQEYRLLRPVACALCAFIRHLCTHSRQQGPIL